jgi:Uma2 family endonuclease
MLVIMPRYPEYTRRTRTFTHIRAHRPRIYKSIYKTYRDTGTIKAVSSATILLTDKEFLALPHSPGKQELVDGELIELPPAKHAHDELARRIAKLLETVLAPSQIWIASGYRLAEREWLTPDVSVSWPEQPIINEYKSGSPMIAVEIASRGNTPGELERKRIAYLDHGCGELWIVYPETRTLLVCTRAESRHIEADEDYHSTLAGVIITPDYRTPKRAG